MDLNGKVAVVTGAASGMGRLTAQRLALRGANVAALDVNRDGLAETESLHSNIRSFICDISDNGQVNSVLDTVRSELGNIDRLVHCAAVMPMCSLSEMAIEKVLQVMRINYEGTVYITRAVLPDMVKQNKGDMIVFGSVAGEIPMPYGGAYCASKGAVNGYMKQLISENQLNGVKIMLVCPPAVNTPLLDQSRTGMNYDFEKQKRQKLVVEPEVLLDIVDKAFAKGRKIVYPTWVAKFVIWFCRLMPETFMKQTFKSALQDVYPAANPSVALSSKQSER